MQKRSVLFVDDDVIVLQSLERGLMDESYNKLFAKTCEEALEILRQKKVNVIVTDMCMPEMNGLELLRAAKKDHPNIIGIVITGYELDPELQKAFDHGEVFKLIPKPWKLTENFKTLTQQAVDNYNLKSECKTIRL